MFIFFTLRFRSILWTLVLTFLVSITSANSAVFDAALDGGEGFEGKSYLFTSDRYRRLDWDSDSFDDGGSFPNFVFHLPPEFRNNLDAGLTGQGAYKRWGYLFKGSKYVAYDWQTWNVHAEPGELSDWNLPAPFDQGIDAAVNGKGQYVGKAFFFKGGEYVRYDWSNGQVDSGYPKPLSAWQLSGDFANGIDGVLSDPDGDLYFVLGDRVVRYNWTTNLATAPMDLLTTMPALANLGDPPSRRIILYVTIDPYESEISKTPAGRGFQAVSGHKPNMRGVITQMERYRVPGRPFAYVDPWWGRDVDAQMLADPHVLAVFSGGSYTEWNGLPYHWDETSREKILDDNEAPIGSVRWGDWLTRYFGDVFASQVPAIAVCGSHQGLSGVLAGWDSVRHMVQAVDPMTYGSDIADTHLHPTIFNHEGNELNAAEERGIMGVKIVDSNAPNIGDPLTPYIFQDIGTFEEEVDFYHSHHDEVILERIHPDFELIAALPDNSAQYRSEVQALRYAGSDRVFYSTQFHPEIAGDSLNNGGKLLRNFIDLAWDYWDRHDQATQ